MTAPVPEHRVIFSMVTRQPIPAATVAMAFTRVVLSPQLLLYPFFQIRTDPMLSTHIRTGLPRHHRCPAVTHTSGPTSSKADSFLLNFFPSSALTPQFIFLAQGTWAHQPMLTAPDPRPTPLSDPPAASV